MVPLFVFILYDLSDLMSSKLFVHWTWASSYLSTVPVVTRENKRRAGINVKLSEHGLRNQLFELVRFWTNQCARSHATQRKVVISARPYVSFNFLTKYHSIWIRNYAFERKRIREGAPCIDYSARENCSSLCSMWFTYALLLLRLFSGCPNSCTLLFIK